MDNNEISIIFSTAPDEAEASLIAERLIESGSVACCNIIPGIKSIYRWKGEIKKDDECMLIIKTSKSEVGKVIAEIKSLHSYEVPEIISIPVIEGNEDYIQWVKSITKGG